MTWNDLLRCIANMDVEDRSKIVKFIEPYDNSKVCYIENCDKSCDSIKDEDVDTIEPGEWFLSS